MSEYELNEILKEIRDKLARIENRYERLQIASRKARLAAGRVNVMVLAMLTDYKTSGYTSKQIAEILGISDAYVRNTDAWKKMRSITKQTRNNKPIHTMFDDETD